MKQKIVIISISVALVALAASCAEQKEIVKPVPPPIVIAQPPPPPPPPPPPKKYRTVLICEEDTSDVYNRSGMEVLPFIRAVFHDFDGDGTDELVAGTKNGTLRLYRKVEQNGRPVWSYVDNYFDGIQVGAFSAPAVGDADGDGRAEIAVGTGGFSKSSGKVLFYRNVGTVSLPRWTQMESNEIDVGNDAAPSFADVDQDGRPDLIVGDSTGTLTLFRNRSRDGRLNFLRDAGYFRGMDFGMYAVPAAQAANGKLAVFVGNSMGGVTLLERRLDAEASWNRTKLDLDIVSFAAPALMRNSRTHATDLVVADGNGQIHYFVSRNGSLRSWDNEARYFSQRLLAGAACAPSLCSIDGTSYLVVGNINGELKLFEHLPVADAVPWKERPGYFRNLRLSSFVRGVITEWNGRHLLVTGQQDGILKAFINNGTSAKPNWVEQKQFFRGVPKLLHASPAVFDLDRDGAWELIVGDVDGGVSAYRMERGDDARPLWKPLTGYFERVRAGRYASPSLAADGKRTYLFVGQQDGSVVTYLSDPVRFGTPSFIRDGLLEEIRMRNHSSPWVVGRDGNFELSVGDYDGNLKHFVCRKTQREEPAD
ncbi:MAG: hypothetical protein OHK006_08780 [Thermodesulfovibrionales bacterium]